MGSAPTARLELARKTLPKPLERSLRHVFAQGLEGCVLAGGTALAGFYAGHRRSDDLDFFTATESAQRGVVLAIQSLEGIGARVETLHQSAQYYDGVGELEGHRFKITAVCDRNLFRIGRFEELEGGVRIVSLETLLRMKSATLVSRCSEKDLYDLMWLFGCFKDLGFADLVRLGSEIDAGMNAEAALASVEGAILREGACDFALSKKARVVFEEILAFKEQLLQGLADHLKDEPTPALGQLVAKLRSKG